MEFFILIIPVIIFFLAASQVSRNKKFSRMLAAVAGKKGLTLNKDSDFSFPVLNGMINGYPVDLFKTSVSYGKSSVAVLAFEVSLKEAALPPFSLSVEGFVSGVKRLFGENDIQTGDSHFDEKILINSFSPDKIRALLGKQARTLIEDSMEISCVDNFKISEEKIEQYIRLSDIKSEWDIIKILDDLLELAGLLCRQGNPAALTIENFMDETDNGAQKKQLITLYNQYTGFAVSDPLIKKALNNHNREVQFYGARLLKGNSSGIFKNLYAQADNSVKIMIIKHLTQRKDAAFLDFFLYEAEKRESTDINRELAAYFADTENPGAEPFLRQELIAALDNTSPGDPNYTRALIQALKTCGTFESIEPLYRIKHFSLKKDADKAIATIQARIGTGESGWLSLSKTDTAEGNLSLTEEDEGEH